MRETLRNATQLVDALALRGYDYAKVVDLLEQQIWKEGHYDGNWDVTTDLPKGYRNLRAIQEDEYDQHRTSDMPEWGDMVCSRPVYVWFE